MLGAHELVLVLLRFFLCRRHCLACMIGEFVEGPLHLLPSLPFSRSYRQGPESPRLKPGEEWLPHLPTSTRPSRRGPWIPAPGQPHRVSLSFTINPSVEYKHEGLRMGAIRWSERLCGTPASRWMTRPLGPGRPLRRYAA